MDCSNFITSDWLAYQEFWKFYNYDVGKKFVRVAKVRAEKGKEKKAKIGKEEEIKYSDSK